MSEKIKDGPFKEYHENGQLKREGVYKDGKLDGSVKNYDKERITIDENWENGTLIDYKVIDYYGDSRQIYQEVTYVHFFDGGPCISGPFKTYYQNGRLKEEGMTSELSQDKHQLPDESEYHWGGVEENDGWDDIMYNHPPIDEDVFLQEKIKSGLHGTYRMYYENGQLEEEGTYKDGERDGLWKLYYENGQLFKEGTLKKGERHGPYKNYFDNGELWEEGTYKNGKQDGLFKLYHWETGQLSGGGVYKDGKKDGLWKSYSLYGTLLRELTYKDGEIIDSKMY